MRLHALQHVPFENLGAIADWAAERQAAVTYTRFFEDPALPPLEDVDFLVVLGGPMSVNDEAQHPWLDAEKRYLLQALDRQTPLLGICLGAQLIASALGARVYPAPAKEIGWHPVFGEPAPADAFAFPAQIDVFQWHGETFDLPPGARRLARSAVCPNQAFQCGTRAIALQFHLETTPSSAQALVHNCADELVPGPHVHSAQQILCAPPTRYAHINALLRSLLAFLHPCQGPKLQG
jgi:GMP synthase-like glutamine amidotransferase